MSSQEKKFYLYSTIICMAGYAWIAINLIQKKLHFHQKFGFCLFKTITGYPCPSCGATRSAIRFLERDFPGSLSLNPIGIILLLIAIVLPFWIGYDLILKQKTLKNFYGNCEILLKRKPFIVIFSLLIAVNWVWNISKGL